MTEVDEKTWSEFFQAQPTAHILQSARWAKFKQNYGWYAKWILTRCDDSLSTREIGAQILFRQLLPGVIFAYIPRGPVVGDANIHGCSTFWKEVDTTCVQERAIFLKVEADLWHLAQTDKTGLFEDGLVDIGFREGTQTIQPRSTLLVSLTGSDDEILGRMKQKTRYNIRLALKKGIVVSPSSDIETFYKLMETTGQRDGFPVHSKDYYQKAYDIFHPYGEAELLIAKFEGEPIAGMMVFLNGERAWYFYGASSGVHRERMPNYLLQWEAMKWARARGCVIYDLWGVPDEDLETLEGNFLQRNYGLWGVYRFKRGFGGELHSDSASLDKVYNPILYKLYEFWAKNLR